MFKRKLEFGNFTLLFGEKKVMLDHLLDIVMPSFHEMRYIRKIKNSDYFFIDTELIIIDDSNKEEPILGISGRIVHNTLLKREQIFTHGELVDNRKVLESAPSSSFLLILNNHRLIFSKEVSGGPSIGNFKSTCQNFLNKQYNEYINEQYKINKINKITKKQLEIETPQPILRITPLSSSEALEDFISRFEHINDISIKLLETNNEEIDNDDFWSSLDKSREEMNSKTVKVQYNSSEYGLKSDKVYEEINAASALGNSEIIINGKDFHGDKIRGNNNDFKLTVDIKSPTREISDLVKVKYHEFLELVSNSIIVAPIVESKSIAKIKAVYNFVFDKNE